MGISEYELTRALPPSLRSALPTVEEIEAELADTAAVQADHTKSKRPKAAKATKLAAKKQPKKGRRT
jgi:hypothetical protein